MQHADETQLSAYLDKQLEYADSDRRRELGRHIADCSKCSKLLKEMRSIRTETEELLERTDTVSVAVPSFDAVVQRARAIRTGEIEIDTPEVADSLPLGFGRFGEGEGLEAAGLVVARVVANAHSTTDGKRPGNVYAAGEHTEVIGVGYGNANERVVW